MIIFSIQFTCMGILETFLLKDTARLNFFKMCTLPRPHLGFHIKVQIFLLLFGNQYFYHLFHVFLFLVSLVLENKQTKKPPHNQNTPHKPSQSSSTPIHHSVLIVWQQNPKAPCQFEHPHCSPHHGVLRVAIDTEQNLGRSLWKESALTTANMLYLHFPSSMVFLEWMTRGFDSENNC